MWLSILCFVVYYCGLSLSHRRHRNKSKRIEGFSLLFAERSTDSRTLGLCATPLYFRRRMTMRQQHCSIDDGGFSREFVSTMTTLFSTTTHHQQQQELLSI
jgi:hypothetical protein